MILSIAPKAWVINTFQPEEKVFFKKGSMLGFVGEIYGRVNLSNIKKSTRIWKGVHLLAGELVRITGFSLDASLESLSIVSAGRSAWQVFC